MITKTIDELNIHKLTEEQYSRAMESGDIDETAMYLTPDLGESGRAFSLNNVVCIGDSFLAGAEANGYGWGDALRDMEQKVNPYAQFRKNAQGWTGFVRTLNGINFKNLVENQADSMTESERAKVETVIIIGGVNDVRDHRKIDSSDTDFTPYNIEIDEIVDLAKTRFPIAKIVIAMSPICSKAEMVASCYKELRKPSTDPRVCILTDSYNWILGEASFVSQDGLHPNRAGYEQIAAHLFSASRGVTCESHYEYAEEYSVVAESAVPTVDGKKLPHITGGNVSVEFYKSGNVMSIRVSGTITHTLVDGSDYIWIGNRPSWMCHLHDTLIPVWGTQPNTALYFSGSGFFIKAPGSSGTVAFNGCSTVSLDIL